MVEYDSGILPGILRGILPGSVIHCHRLPPIAIGPTYHYPTPNNRPKRAKYRAMSPPTGIHYQGFIISPQYYLLSTIYLPSHVLEIRIPTDLKLRSTGRYPLLLYRWGQVRRHSLDTQHDIIHLPHPSAISPTSSFPYLPICPSCVHPSSSILHHRLSPRHDGSSIFDPVRRCCQ